MEETGRKPVKLIFISTGTGKIRPSMRSRRTTNFAGRYVAIRRLRSFTDCNWSHPLPIAAFVISHLDGPILFDTGETPRCNDPEYLSLWSPDENSQQHHNLIRRGDVAQLLAHGIEPKCLQAIVLSHLHGYHAGGLKDMVDEAPGVPVYLSCEQWHKFSNNPFQATLQECAPQDWPMDFKPWTLEFTDYPDGPQMQSEKLTPDGKVVAVHTPGHVPGHTSLIVYGDNDDGT